MLPSTMRALRAEPPGPADNLTIVELAVPEPPEGYVLIKVAAAGVNRLDIMQRMGRYPAPDGAPDTLGLEVSGEVVALGPEVSGVKEGNQVCALVIGGGYADYCLAHAGSCLPIPDGVSLIEAGGLPETYFTVWTNVFELAKLLPGERLLVHGATSGIGVTAIQLAKAFGAEVATTAGSEEKCAFARDLGADVVINYKTDQFEDVVKEAGGADVVLDMIGGDYYARNVSCMNPFGRHVTIAFINGTQAGMDLTHVLRKSLRLFGSTLRKRSNPEKARIAEGLAENVWPLFAEGRVKPIVDQTFSFSEAAVAHKRMEKSAHIGKILLIP